MTKIIRNPHVFMLQDAGDKSQHTLHEVTAQEAMELTEAGVAVEADMSDYHRYRKEIQRLHKSFKSAEERIKQDDDPRNTDEVKRYDLDKAKKEYMDEAERLQAEWDAYRAEQIEAAKIQAARATVRVNQSDKDTAKQFADRLALKIVSTPNAATLSSIIEQAKSDVGRLSDGQKTALQSSIADVIEKVNEKAERLNAKSLTRQARELATAAADIRDESLLVAKVAEALPRRIDTEYRQTALVKGWIRP